MKTTKTRTLAALAASAALALACIITSIPNVEGQDTPVLPPPRMTNGFNAVWLFANPVSVAGNTTMTTAPTDAIASIRQQQATAVQITATGDSPSASGTVTLRFAGRVGDTEETTPSFVVTLPLSGEDTVTVIQIIDCRGLSSIRLTSITTPPGAGIVNLRVCASQKFQSITVAPRVR